MAEAKMKIKVRFEFEKPKFELGQIVRFKYDGESYGQIRDIRYTYQSTEITYGIQTKDDYVEIPEKDIFER